MENCKVRFKYLDEEVVIQCQRNELMRDIISQYVEKTGLSSNELFFLYNLKEINMDITLAQINSKDKEILINVNSKEIEENENEKKKLHFIKFDQCSDIFKKNSEIEKFLNKKRKNSGDLETLNYIENNLSSEITLQVKIEQNDVNKIIYFLDNTSESTYSYGYIEKGRKDFVKHNHDNLKELNESNTTLIIDGETVPYKKFFIPTKIGTFSIKLLLNVKLSNCAYMFCECKNIIDIVFSNFNTEDVTDMQRMFSCCSGLKSLNLSSFNTQNVTDMGYMFG